MSRQPCVLGGRNHPLHITSQKALLAKLHQNIEVFRNVDLNEDSRMTLAQWLDY